MDESTEKPETGRKLDRRTRRTRRLLGDALVSLILEKGYDEVSVEDITERADLGRTTFYLHYKDKGDLLLERIDEIADDLITQVNQRVNRRKVLDLSQLSADTVIESGPAIFLFQHAYENASFYRVILRGEGAARTTRHFREIVNTYLGTYFKTMIAPEPVIPAEVITNYFSGSLLALLTWWLENDTPYTAEEMAIMFRKLFFMGCGWALGIRPKNKLPAKDMETQPEQVED